MSLDLRFPDVTFSAHLLASFNKFFASINSLLKNLDFEVFSFAVLSFR